MNKSVVGYKRYVDVQKRRWAGRAGAAPQLTFKNAPQLLRGCLYTRVWAWALMRVEVWVLFHQLYYFVLIVLRFCLCRNVEPFLLFCVGFF